MPCGAVAKAKEIGVDFIWELQGDFHLARCEYRRIPHYFEGSCIFMQQKNGEPPTIPPRGSLAREAQRIGDSE